MTTSVNYRLTAVLGVVTIAAYGSWYYSFGVLLDPIRLDTGWRESTLAASFSIGIVVTGIGSLFGGRLLDRVGHRVVFLLAGLISAASFTVVSVAPNVEVFILASALGQGSLGALGFYHVTMTTTVRLNPHAPAKAIAVLTIWGALASAIYLPTTALLVERLEWRTTVRILGLTAAAVFVTASVLLPPAAESSDADGPRPSLRSVISGAMGPGAPRWFALAVSCGGIAMSTMLVYQVPTMTALGLSAASAASFAGVRGFAQLGGRLPLGFLLDRLGVDRSLILAFVAIGAGGALLAVANDRPTALAFAIVAGFGIGAFSPLQGIKSQELFATESLGATMGFYGALMMLVGAVGPAVAGVLADWTGDRRWASAVVVATAIGAASSVSVVHRYAREGGERRPHSKSSPGGSVR